MAAEGGEQRDFLPKLVKGNYYAWSRKAKAELVERNCWNVIEPGYGNVDVDNLNQEQAITNRKALCFLLR